MFNKLIGGNRGKNISKKEERREKREERDRERDREDRGEAHDTNGRRCLNGLSFSSTCRLTEWEPHSPFQSPGICLWCLWHCVSHAGNWHGVEAYQGRLDHLTMRIPYRMESLPSRWEWEPWRALPSAFRIPYSAMKLCYPIALPKVLPTYSVFRPECSSSSSPFVYDVKLEPVPCLECGELLRKPAVELTMLTEGCANLLLRGPWSGTKLYCPLSY